MDHPGKLIYTRRRELKLSRKALVELSGVGKTALYDVEHGKPTVQLDTLQKLCEVLGLELVIRPLGEKSVPAASPQKQTPPVPSDSPSAYEEPEELPDYLL
jgi:transcriptional regulator with XRE-family HTH domain